MIWILWLVGSACLVAANIPAMLAGSVVAAVSGLIAAVALGVAVGIKWRRA